MSGTGASAIFAEEDFSSYAQERDVGVAEALPLYLSAGLTVHSPAALRQDDGQPCTVFTPFSKAWKALTLPPVRDVLRPPTQLSPLPDVGSFPIPRDPALSSLVPFQPGEAEAQRRLQAFVDWRGETHHPASAAPIYRYDELRDRLDVGARPGCPHT